MIRANVRLISPDESSARLFRFYESGKAVVVRLARDDLHRDEWEDGGFNSMTRTAANTLIKNLKREGWRVG